MSQILKNKDESNEKKRGDEEKKRKRDETQKGEEKGLTENPIRLRLSHPRGRRETAHRH